jgi:hypothetical protein
LNDRLGRGDRLKFSVGLSRGDRLGRSHGFWLDGGLRLDDWF